MDYLVAAYSAIWTLFAGYFAMVMFKTAAIRRSASHKGADVAQGGPGR